MTSKDLFETLGHIDPEYRQQAVKALFAKELQEMEEESMNKKTYRRVGRTLLIAAAVAALLAVTAFAADIFGVQALLTGGRVMDPTGEEYYELVFNKPQAVPEGLDPQIARLVENNQAAQAEWDEYCSNRSPRTAMETEWKTAAPEGTVGWSAFKVEDINEADGDFWILVQEEYPTAFAVVAYMGNDGSILGGQPITEEEWALYVEQVEASASEESAEFSELYCGEYDIYSQADADKLEEIAAKYGLKLVEERHRVFHGAPEEELSEEKLTETMTAADGTELTVLSDSENVIVYGFLDDAFFAECVTVLPAEDFLITPEDHGTEPLTQADIDYIVDFFNYSLIEG